MLSSIILSLILLPSVFPFKKLEFLGIGKKTGGFGKGIGLGTLDFCIDRGFSDLCYLINRFSNCFQIYDIFL